MNRHLLKLHLERGRLQERIAQQRVELAVQLMPLKRASGTVSRMMALAQDGVECVRKNPLQVSAALAMVVVLRPKSTWRLLHTGLQVWRGWSMLRVLIPETVSSPIYKFIWQRFTNR